jgi:hypothetical protein
MLNTPKGVRETKAVKASMGTLVGHNRTHGCDLSLTFDKGLAAVDNESQSRCIGQFG